MVKIPRRHLFITWTTRLLPLTTGSGTWKSFSAESGPAQKKDAGVTQRPSFVVRSVREGPDVNADGGAVLVGHKVNLEGARSLQTFERGEFMAFHAARVLGARPDTDARPEFTSGVGDVPTLRLRDGRNGRLGGLTVLRADE